MKREMFFLTFVWLIATITQGCASASEREDISRSVPYARLVGKRYKLLNDCFVFKTHDNLEKIPRISNPSHDPDLPKQIDAKSINKEIHRKYILGIIPKGAVFKLESVRRESVVSSFQKWIYTYEISFEDEAWKVWGSINAYYLTDRFNDSPLFFSDSIKPID